MEAKSRFRAHPRQQIVGHVHGMNWKERHRLLFPFPSTPLPALQEDVKRQGEAQTVGPGRRHSPLGAVGTEKRKELPQVGA